MAHSPAEILKLLEKTNCRQCREATCLAFAAAVFKGRRRLEECPRLDPAVAAEHAPDASVQAGDVRQERDLIAAELKKRISEMDLAAMAERTGGKFAQGRLRINVMGKEFAVDADGRLYSQIHLHSWVTIPILAYIVHGAGKPVSGNWVNWRDLPGGREYESLYRQRVELALKKVADEYPDLLEDMLHIFNGRQVDQLFDSDLSLVLYPLPKAPILVCYWGPEEGLESNLTLFFDATAADNVGGIQPLYNLVAGLVGMFEKISRTHGGK